MRFHVEYAVPLLGEMSRELEGLKERKQDGR